MPSGLDSKPEDWLRDWGGEHAGRRMVSIAAPAAAEYRSDCHCLRWHTADAIFTA